MEAPVITWFILESCRNTSATKDLEREACLNLSNRHLPAAASSSQATPPCHGARGQQVAMVGRFLDLGEDVKIVEKEREEQLLVVFLRLLKGRDAPHPSKSSRNELDLVSRL